MQGGQFVLAIALRAAEPVDTLSLGTFPPASADGCRRRDADRVLTMLVYVRPSELGKKSPFEADSSAFPILGMQSKGEKFPGSPGRDDVTEPVSTGSVPMCIGTPPVATTRGASGAESVPTVNFSVKIALWKLPAGINEPWRGRSAAAPAGCERTRVGSQTASIRPSR